MKTAAAVGAGARGVHHLLYGAVPRSALAAMDGSNITSATAPWSKYEDPYVTLTIPLNQTTLVTGVLLLATDVYMNNTNVSVWLHAPRPAGSASTTPLSRLDFLSAVLCVNTTLPYNSAGATLRCNATVAGNATAAVTIQKWQTNMHPVNGQTGYKAVTLLTDSE